MHAVEQELYSISSSNADSHRPSDDTKVVKVLHLIDQPRLDQNYHGGHVCMVIICSSLAIAGTPGVYLITLTSTKQAIAQRQRCIIDIISSTLSGFNNNRDSFSRALKVTILLFSPTNRRSPRACMHTHEATAS